MQAGCPSLSDCVALQCYLRPISGDTDNLHRVHYSQAQTSVTTIPDGNSPHPGDPSSPVDKSTTTELTTTAQTLASHISLAATKLSLKSRPTSPKTITATAFTADFVLDDNRQLWLCAVHDVTVTETPTVTPPPPTELPKLSPTSPTHAPPRSSPRATSSAIFVKQGAGANTTWHCTQSVTELVGLAAWSDTHTDGTHSISMATLLDKWSNPGAPLTGPPGDHKQMMATKRYKVAYKSVLLAAESESFLTGSVKAESGAALASKWRAADRSCQQALSGKKPSNYYDEVTVDGNCYQVCLKLDALRASGFEIGGPGDDAPPQDFSSRPTSEPASDGRRSRQAKKPNKNAQTYNADSNAYNDSAPPSSAGSVRPNNDKMRDSLTNREAFLDKPTMPGPTTHSSLDEKENTTGSKNLKKVKNIYEQADPRSKKSKGKNKKNGASIDMDEFQKFMDEADSPTKHLPATSTAVAANNLSTQNRIDQQLKKKKVSRDADFSTSQALKKTPAQFADETSDYAAAASLEAAEIQQEITRASMSKTERDFLQRRGIESQTPQIPEAINSAFPSTSQIQSQYAKQANRADANSEVVNSMRDRITEMETDIKHLKSKAKSAEEAALEFSNKAKDANRKLAMAQKKFTGAMSEKDDEHDRNLLELGADLNSAKAETANLKSQLSMANSSSAMNVANPTNSSYQQELLKKVESLHKEMSDNQKRFNEEKRALMSTQAKANQDNNSTHRNELNDMRDTTAQLEDRVGDMNEKVSAPAQRTTSIAKRQSQIACPLVHTCVWAHIFSNTRFSRSFARPRRRTGSSSRSWPTPRRGGSSRPWMLTSSGPTSRRCSSPCRPPSRLIWLRARCTRTASLPSPRSRRHLTRGSER